MRRVSMLFFWITPATCVSSIFLFAFGVSLLSYFLTGAENVDMWTVLKLMESLPDPREFLNASLKIFNSFSSVAQKVKYFKINELNGNPLLNTLVFIANGFVSVVRGFVTIIGFISSMAVSIVTFPVYCVFFTLRTCGAFLTLLNIDVPYTFLNMSWDDIFNPSYWLNLYS